MTQTAQVCKRVSQKMGCLIILPHKENSFTLGQPSWKTSLVEGSAWKELLVNNLKKIIRIILEDSETYSVVFTKYTTSLANPKLYTFSVTENLACMM